MTPEYFDAMIKEGRFDDLVDWVIQYKFGGVSDEELKSLHNTSRSDIYKKLEQYMPRLQDVDQTKAAILGEQYGVSPGTDEIYGTESDILEEVGAGPDGIYGTDDDTGGTIGRTAGLQYGQAGRTFESSLDQLNPIAHQIGALPSTGVGARTKRRGLKSMSTGLESAYDIYGAAGEAYDLAGDVHKTDYWSSIYGLEKSAGTQWEAEWTSFLDTLG